MSNAIPSVPAWTAADLRRLISADRFERYLAGAAGSSEAAAGLYGRVAGWPARSTRSWAWPKSSCATSWTASSASFTAAGCAATVSGGLSPRCPGLWEAQGLAAR
ncbi:MAG TPA: hypothetical protein VN969_31205 [Streptosporangiaceae bacterium]|nr:hypothetical protein [Streptosporangiaceae bacterium]